MSIVHVWIGNGKNGLKKRKSLARTMETSKIALCLCEKQKTACKARNLGRVTEEKPAKAGTLTGTLTGASGRRGGEEVGATVWEAAFVAGDFNLCAQGDVFAGVANEDFQRARFDAERHVRIVESEQVAGELERYPGGLTGCEGYFYFKSPAYPISSGISQRRRAPV